MFKHILKSILISAFLYTWFCPVQAQKDTSRAILFDSARIKPYQVSATFYDKYYSSKHFQYLKESDTNPSFWKQLWRKIMQLFSLALSTSIGSILIFGFFLVALIVFIVILSGADLQAIIQRNPTVKNVNFYNVAAETNNLEEKLQLSLKNKDFTEAIRLLYLITLQKLDKIQLINWHKDKTNRDYLLELLNTRYFEPFSRITKIYEYTWYGKFPVTHTEYKVFEKDFTKMKELINAQ
jgi:hypothetical protein